MLELNVHFNSRCEGCHLHKYPYEAVVPISGYGKKVFKSNKDVFDIIKLLIAEVKETNKNMSKDFDVASSIMAQLPYFSCINIVLKNNYQKDISKYLYCKEFSTPPYNGSYGQQPYKWIEKSNIIRYALSKKEQQQIEKQNSKARY